jgi:hypothetical protein
VLYRVDAESRGKVDENPQFTVDIAVNESGVLECEPIIPTLVQLVDVIEALVKEFNPFLP